MTPPGWPLTQSRDSLLSFKDMSLFATFPLARDVLGNFLVNCTKLCRAGPIGASDYRRKKIRRAIKDDICKIYQKHPFLRITLPFYKNYRRLHGAGMGWEEEDISTEETHTCQPSLHVWQGQEFKPHNLLCATQHRYVCTGRVVLDTAAFGYEANGWEAKNTSLSWTHHVDSG